MNAREAREMSGQPKDDEIQHVYDIIKRSIAIGNLYCNVNISTAKLTQAGADFLCDEDGYMVQRISDMRDGDYFSITW